MNPQDPAFPLAWRDDLGLSIRSYIASQALQGIIAASWSEGRSWHDLALYATNAADALIEALAHEAS